MKTSPSAAQASHDIRVALGRFRRRLREVATEGELSPGQASVLARVSKDEAHTVSALARSEGVRPQSMASTVASLDALGLITRTPDPSDGRRQIVTLTTAGRRLDLGNRAARGEWLAGRLDAHCTEEERRTLIAAAQILERLARA
ncbi:winged helix-turn-helix transcriptional regulator [Allobranchiibius sp. CTAmp26]|nr:winged helix-turn-helix transcriptional regulator [Allobranchiibius sp. CTAmp26]